MRLSSSLALNLLSTLLLAAIFAASPSLSQVATTSHAEALTRVRAATTTLLTSYNPQTGLFKTTGWWNSANAITALTDASRLTHDKSLRTTLRNTLDHAPNKFPNFLNEYYDDEGWWALAWIDAYDLTHDKRYLHTAQAIFTNMSGGWDTTCGGGIWWRKDRHYKNAIANELFLSVAANLALHARGKQRAAYLDWATREWTWFAQTGMINADNLVNDGLTLDAATGVCRNNGRNTWSYNQGVILGGLAALHQVAPQPDLLPAANRIATAAITRLTDAEGILHDPGEPKLSEDSVQFKGILTRNLATLQTTAPDPRYTAFLQTNADALWTRARNPDSGSTASFGLVWSGPPAPGNAGTQSSALDAFNAAATVTR